MPTLGTLAGTSPRNPLTSHRGDLVVDCLEELREEAQEAELGSIDAFAG